MGEPDRPAGLSNAAAAVWAAVVPLLGEGVLSRDNGQSLSRYCHDLVRWWKLAAWMETNDEVIEVRDANDRIVKTFRHANVISYEKLSTTLLRMEQEFGLTPSSRTRVHAIVSKKPAAKPKGDAPPAMRIAN